MALVHELAASLGVEAIRERLANREHAATDARLRLQHLHVKASLSQRDRRSEAGQPGSDHDDIGGGGQRHTSIRAGTVNRTPSLAPQLDSGNVSSAA